MVEGVKQELTYVIDITDHKICSREIVTYGNEKLNNTPIKGRK
jgi:hypothetical protein